MSKIFEVVTILLIFFEDMTRLRFENMTGYGIILGFDVVRMPRIWVVKSHGWEKCEYESGVGVITALTILMLIV